MKSNPILWLPLLLFCILTAGCGYGSNYNHMQGTAPKITQLSPQNVVANSGAFPLTIEGSGFNAGSVVYWNMTALPATVDSSSQLTVAISGAMVANAGSVPVHVHTTGGNSNTMMFNIN
ncbi:MAG TPA: IPT/TIG domain-containing protein [Terriglobales bacterium]